MPLSQPEDVDEDVDVDEDEDVDEHQYAHAHAHAHVNAHVNSARLAPAAHAVKKAQYRRVRKRPPPGWVGPRVPRRRVGRRRPRPVGPPPVWQPSRS